MFARIYSNPLGAFVVSIAVDDRLALAFSTFLTI
jgi:hypothetical protein